MEPENSTLAKVHSLFTKDAARSDKPRQAARLLVVDDDETETVLLAHELKKVNVEALCARDGMQAINLVAAEKLRASRTPLFDLILLDLKMPKISGPETMVKLRLLASTWCCAAAR